MCVYSTHMWPSNWPINQFSIVIAHFFDWDKTDPPLLGHLVTFDDTYLLSIASFQSMMIAGSWWVGGGVEGGTRRWPAGPPPSSTLSRGKIDVDTFTESLLYKQYRGSRCLCVSVCAGVWIYPPSQGRLLLRMAVVMIPVSWPAFIRILSRIFFF